MNEKQEARIRRATNGGATPPRASAITAMTITQDELKVAFRTFIDHTEGAEPSLVAALESIGFIVERPISVSKGAVAKAGSNLPMSASPGQIERAIQAAVRVMIDEGVIRLPD